MEQRGQGMAADIAEQPEVLERLIGERSAEIDEIAKAVAAYRPRHVIFAARGTSDHAALYGAYLAEIRLALPAALASPSAITLFGARPDLRDTLVVGVSQSGGSPDISEVLRVAGEQGALTLAVTNAPSSTLAQTARLHIDISAGPERAVAATKSYTAELLALLLLIEGIRGLDEEDRAFLAELPDLVRTTLADGAAAQLAQRYRFAEQIVTTGRGFAYPTAREAALKLMETSYVAALAFSGADLLHGPLAMTDPGVPVLAVVGTGPGGASMAGVLGRLAERGADLVVVGAGAAELRVPHLPTPAVDERFAPLLDILPLQQLALNLALARGEDPDRPRGLKKITATL